MFHLLEHFTPKSSINGTEQEDGCGRNIDESASAASAGLPGARRGGDGDHAVADGERVGRGRDSAGVAEGERQSER